MSSLHEGFQEPARSADAGSAAAALRWLDQADGHPIIQQIKQHMLDVCPVRPGDHVLDVGCGIGHEARRLAGLTGPGGRVTGIDANPAMIEEARRRGEGSDLPVTFEVGDARQLDLPDGVFDLCRTERVLRYLDRPQAALAEMARMTRPGGSVVAFDWDSDSTVIDMPDAALVRRMTDVLDAAVPHPWAGRELYGLFKRAGLTDVRAVTHAMCVTGRPGFAIYAQLNRGTISRALEAGSITADEVARWWQALEEAAESGTFFVASLGLIAVGTRP